MSEIRMTYYKYSCPNRIHEFVLMGDTETCIHCWGADHPTRVELDG